MYHAIRKLNKKNEENLAFTAEILRWEKKPIVNTKNTKLYFLTI